jgi:hypothetical protein
MDPRLYKLCLRLRGSRKDRDPESHGHAPLTAQPKRCEISFQAFGSFLQFDQHFSHPLYKSSLVSFSTRTVPNHSGSDVERSLRTAWRVPQRSDIANCPFQGSRRRCSFRQPVEMSATNIARQVLGYELGAGQGTATTVPRGRDWILSDHLTFI